MSKPLFAVVVFLFAITCAGCANQQTSNSNGNPSAAVSAEPTPDKPAIEAQLKALEYDWPRIVKERDGATVRKMEADDILLTYPDGSEGTKEDDIRDIEAGALANDPQEVIDVTVNVLDNNTAIARSRTRVEGDNYKMSDGKCETIIREFRTVDTFVRRNGQWQVVASVTVPVRNPAPAATPSATPTESATPKIAPPRTSPVPKVSPAKAASPTRKPTP
jgi:ketosteroid isomerase-like protein